MALGLVSSLLRDFSRELGQLTPALISGALIILCCLYVSEPLAVGILTDELVLAMVFGALLGWDCCGLESFCAHLLVDASLLAWLKRFVIQKDLR